MKALACGVIVLAIVAGCTRSAPAPSNSAAPDKPITSTTPADEKRAVPADQTAAAKPGNAKPAGKFSVGDPAPAFQGLTGIDEKQHSLNEYAAAKALAVVFTCNHCPVAQAYEDRLVALDKEYAGKGVRLVAINVSNLEADKLPAMKERAAAKGFNFAYLYDPSQEIGRKFGAAVTPHVFLLDSKQRLAYVGPVDDSQDQGKVTRQYLREAIDAVLTEKSPEKTDVTPFGCGINYE
jgi:peroxiredoxin